jgi:predicted short-subunit dehydrogenase-like oxidoreductase (DUF2520 family)
MIPLSEISSVAFIGSGKVTNVLSAIFLDRGVSISGISSRNQSSGKELSQKIGCEFFDDESVLRSDLIVVAVNDDAVKSVIERINPSQQVVYTAGSIELKNISHPNCGVFYPLQTFTQGKKLDSTEIPILIETNQIEFRQELEHFCSKLGFHFQYCESEQRKQYHLSAVILNNFMHHLAYISKIELEEKGLDWNVLIPLLKETFDKIVHSDLHEGQTGPARRGDLKVIQEHQKMLTGKHLEIYNVITNSILDTYKK